MDCTEAKAFSNHVVDITGMRFGKWTVIGFDSIDHKRHALWLCRCDCGTERLVVGARLTKKGRPSRSCGCMQSKTTHGQTRRGKRTRTYKIWCQLHCRCDNPNIPNYKHYGGRGIKVCERWKSFENFYEDMGDPPTNRHSLDRIDNNKGYCKENCRWATQLQQTRNSRHNHILTFDGKSMCVTEWAEHVGLPAQSIYNRLRSGWSVERTLTTPPLRRRKQRPAA